MLKDSQHGNGRSDRGDEGRGASRAGSVEWSGVSYQRLVERVPAVVYVDASDDASSALYMSPRVDAMLGYTPDEWLADPEMWVRLLHPEDRGRVLAEHQRTRRTGELFAIEYRLVARDGRIVWVRDEAELMSEEAFGFGERPVWYGLLADVTERREAEAALVRSEERFRRLVESVREGIARISPEGGVIEYCNPAYASVLGLTREEAVGRSFFEFVEGGDEREARRQRELRLAGVGSEYELVVTTVAGEKRIILCGGYPLYGADGVYEGAVQTVMDVTGRRRSEESLKTSEERFRLVAKASGEAIWDNDLLTGVQQWDGATEALFGYPPQRSETGVWWEERIHPEDKDRVLSGLGMLYEGDEDLWADEYRFRRADGTYAVIVDRGFVVRDGKGAPSRMVGSMADVTERRRMEAELRESEELFRKTFEAAAVGMAHVSLDGRWLRVNDTLCQISGYRREELLGMSYLDLTLPEDLAAGEERVRRLLAGETGPYSVERRYVREDGSRVWVDLSVSLMSRISGEPDYLVCVARDATARKIEELVPDPLTPREMKVLGLVVLGKTDPKIARELSYSLGTVKLEVRDLLRKLGVSTRHEAATRAIEIGLVPHKVTGNK